ncbi:MAG TPA: hypothetical protein VLB49_04855 [Gemmatimonadales bacterium]|nr:hypothetical protein [Gemmatimonadales bacterium]
MDHRRTDRRPGVVGHGTPGRDGPTSLEPACPRPRLLLRDHLPEPGFEKSDRVFTTGIQILF